MKSDRRYFAIHGRRNSCGKNPRHGGTVGLGKTNAAISATPTAAIENDAFSRRKSARLREKLLQLPGKTARLRGHGIAAREVEVGVRENAANGRELRVLQREDAAAARECEIRVAQAPAATQEDFNSKLRQANEHLVITSLQFQTMAEQLEKSKKEMTHFATHDFLTDLPNRMQLKDRINQAIALAKRHEAKLAVLFLDLDRFKIINDSLGHSIGDKLLQAVAQRLKSAIRYSDTVSRHGGDEFLLLLPDVSSEETLALKIEKIHRVITAPYNISGNDLHIGATIGISIFPQDGDDAKTLIRNADTAMYYAKEHGRNKYQFFRQEMHAIDTERLNVEAGLYQALARHQFVLFYQAQVDLQSGAITGAEALIRWNHPSRGLLAPAYFIPVAEDCGAIVPIGRWVLREACRQAQSWLAANLAFNVIAVNISAREFDSGDFLQNVCAALRETGLAPNRLELELTETVLMKSIEGTAATLHALRAMGVRISIDDFGTGYSSLGYLKRFPVDTLKIDQSFVRELANGDDEILVNAMISIGKGLRHLVIAEGVETAQQLAFLRENQCPVGQGFYLNVPMNAEEFAAVLEQGVAAPVA